MPTKLGEYTVRSGGAAVTFWPLNPGTTLAQATPPAPVAPVNPNPIVLPPAFAMFDVVIRLTDDPVESNIPAPTLLAQVSAGTTVSAMPLTKEADGTAHICFAVAPSSGTTFEGILRLSATPSSSPAAAIQIDLKIKAVTNTLADN